MTPIRPFSNGDEEDDDDTCQSTAGYYEEVCFLYFSKRYRLFLT